MKALRPTLLALIFSPILASAQANDPGVWYIYFGNVRATDSKLSLDIEAQYRNHDFGGDMQQLLVRSGIKYDFADNFNATVGYAFVQSEAENEPDNPTRENRIYQEGVLSQNTGRFFFRHRFRYEQRFREGQDFNTRYRYCLFLYVPLNKPTLEKNAVYLAVYNEIFINGIKTDDTPGVFDRDRIYLGAGYKITSSLGIQLGWMNQILENSSKSQLMLSIHHKLKL